MKHLYLLRHADAHPDNAHDFDRTITPFGKHQVEQLSEVILKQGYTFDKILVSSAKRTQETVAHLTKQPFELVDVLYNANQEILLDVVQAQPENVNHLLVCAHNPGISELGMYLSSTPIDYFSTATLMYFTFGVDTWDALKARSGNVVARL